VKKMVNILQRQVVMVGLTFPLGTEDRKGQQSTTQAMRNNKQ
jgi:hypothetical protein